MRKKCRCAKALAKFKELGLKVVDSSSSYGTAEEVVGEIGRGTENS